MGNDTPVFRGVYMKYVTTLTVFTYVAQVGGTSRFPLTPYLCRRVYGKGKE